MTTPHTIPHDTAMKRWTAVASILCPTLCSAYHVEAKDHEPQQAERDACDAGDLHFIHLVLTHTNSDADRAKGDPVDFFDAAPFGFAPSLWLPRPFCAIAAEEVEKRHGKQMLKRADG
jgi:hypothetical protein